MRIANIARYDYKLVEACNSDCVVVLLCAMLALSACQYAAKGLVSSAGLARAESSVSRRHWPEPNFAQGECTDHLHQQTKAQ